MTDIFICGNTSAAEIAINNLNKAMGGKFSASGGDKKAAMDGARFLILALSSAADYENRSISADWQYYLNEITWKRKKSGEVIILASEELDFARIPYKLKNVTYFTYNEAQELVDYMTNQMIVADSVTAKMDAVPQVKQIKYSPRPPAVEQIKFSARAASVDSFDGDKKYHMKETSACYDDHIYETNASGNNSSAQDYRNARNANNNKVEKKSGGKGCLVVGILAALALVIGIVIYGIVSSNLYMKFSADMPRLTQVVSTAVNLLSR